MDEHPHVDRFSLNSLDEASHREGNVRAVDMNPARGRGIRGGVEQGRQGIVERQHLVERLALDRLCRPVDPEETALPYAARLRADPLYAEARDDLDHRSLG